MVDELIVGLRLEMENVEAFADELEDVDVNVDALRESFAKVWDEIAKIREKHLK